LLASCPCFVHPTSFFVEIRGTTGLTEPDEPVIPESDELCLLNLLANYPLPTSAEYSSSSSVLKKPRKNAKNEEVIEVKDEDEDDDDENDDDEEEEAIEDEDEDFEDPDEEDS
jgi:hypothetical protein